MTRVRDIMQTELATLPSDTSLPALEEAFLRYRVSGFPVVDDGKLTGIVSRSDVVRQLCVERTRLGMLSDYYWDCSGFVDANEKLFDQLADCLGRRIDHLKVADVMMTEILTVDADQDVLEAARLLIDRHVHRLLVTDGGELAGLISSLDLVRYLLEEGSASDQ